MLYIQQTGDWNRSKPVLVWLHGFLGTADDWNGIASGLPEWPSLLIDLPGHGRSQRQRVSGFAALANLLTFTLRNYQVTRYWLTGYSLGARIAMYYACRAALPGLCGVVAEAGHPGLTDSAQRRARCRQDARWVWRFYRQPLTDVLDAWYCQPLFAGLSTGQRQQLVAERAASHDRGSALAAMLAATSTSRQPDLLPDLRRLPVPFHYLCCDSDNKFRQLAYSAGLPLQLIPQAGHNAHRANPDAFIRQLRHILLQPAP